MTTYAYIYPGASRKGVRAEQDSPRRAPFGDGTVPPTLTFPCVHVLLSPGILVSWERGGVRVRMLTVPGGSYRDADS